MGVGWDVAHRVAVVTVANLTALVDDGQGGHPSEPEQLDLLAVEIRHGMGRVGQADERQIFLPLFVSAWKSYLLLSRARCGQGTRLLIIPHKEVLQQCHPEKRGGLPCDRTTPCKGGGKGQS